MQILIGKLKGRCPACDSEQWEGDGVSPAPSMMEMVTCASCGHEVLCADLALQLPLDGGEGEEALS